MSNRSGENSGVAIKVDIGKENIIIPPNFNQRGIVHTVDGVCRTLISSNHGGNEPKVAIPVLTPDRVKKRQNGRRFKENGGPMFTLTTADRQGVAIGIDTQSEEGLLGILVQLSADCTVYAIWYEKYQCYIAIRRLTPKECFRLQGWKDEYFKKAEFVNSDSQLYRQAGNGVTVNVIQAIAGKLV